ncbi:MAG: sialidase family protein [Gemmatimonadaceae bacterium]
MGPSHSKSRLILVAVCCASTACGTDSRQLPAIARLDTLSSPAAPGSAEPNLSAGSDGRVYLSWIEPAPDSAHALRFSVLEGEQWSAPRTITTSRDFFVNWADFPSLIALPDGRLAAHWLQTSGSSSYSYDVRIAQSRDRGETWGTPVTPHRDSTESEHGFVSLFAAGGDSLGAIWLDGRQYAGSSGKEKKEMMLAFTTLAADGSSEGESFIDERICDCCQTAVAGTAKGPVAVFRDRSPEEIRDIGVTRLIGGAWTTPQPVHRDNWRIDFCPVNGPAISARADQVAVAWFTAARDTAGKGIATDEPDSSRVLLAFSADAGATFGRPIRVNDDRRGQAQGRVDVELLDDGGALVSWIERTGGESAEVRARYVRPDGGRNDAITIAASSAARASGFPRMVQSGKQVIFAWTLPGKPSSIRVARASLSRD